LNGVLLVRFASDSYQPFVKTVPFSFSDFLGNIGGFMGLLAGISILSIVEIFYHITAIKLTKQAQQVHPAEQENRQTAWANEDHLLFQLMKYFSKFIKTSDMHGMNYTQDQTIGKAGRIFWTLLVLLSLTICSVLVIDMNRGAEQSPIATRIDSQMWTLDDVSEEFFHLLIKKRILSSFLADSVSSRDDWTKIKLRQILEGQIMF
jgi:Amiloride-sensitive sodium channel